VHMLVISKAPEFTEDGEVVPGQCEPYTSGWRLRLIANGCEEVLLFGSYYELRRIQRRCVGKTPDEIRAIAAEAAEAMKKAAGPPLSAERDEATQILGADDVRRAMLEMETAATSPPEWFLEEERDGVHLVRVAPGRPERFDADGFGRALQAALEARPGPFVIDLGELDASSPPLATVLRDVGERAVSQGRFLGVVSRHEPSRRALQAAAPSLGLFADEATALRAAAGGAAPGERLP